MDPDNSDKVLITSVEVKEGCCTEQLITDILTNANIPGNIKLQDNPKARVRKTAGPVGSYWFELYDGPDPLTAVLLGESERYSNPDERTQTLKVFENALETINRNEGLHLVEHLLLRPRLDEVFDENNEEIPVSFLNICLQPCDLGIGLDEGDVPKFKKKISRIPAEKCYDKMPWILEYLDQQGHSLLFQKVMVKEDFTTSQTLLKFRKYAALSQRVADLDEYGSEVSNYTIISNNAEPPAVVKYSFVIHNNKGVFSHKVFLFITKKLKHNKQAGTQIEDILTTLSKILLIISERKWIGTVNQTLATTMKIPILSALRVLPCWPKRLRDKTFKNLVEKTISSETPRIYTQGLSGSI